MKSSQNPIPSNPLRTMLGNFYRFSREVFREFRRNKGFLLAGAVAYNTLLSLIPLVAVLFVVLSKLFDEALLASVMQRQLDLWLPGQSQAIESILGNILDDRLFIGWIGLAVLLFFSSVAFRSLQDAMAGIFSRRPERHKLWISFVLPYTFVAVLAVGLLLLTTASTMLDTFPDRELQLLKLHWSIKELSESVLYALGFVGLVIVFTAIYWFLPAASIPLRRALVGGVTAAILWEFTRRLLVWYFANVSLVNVVYGSLATVVIVLLTLEVAAIILLLGAQVIAEVDRFSPTSDGSHRQTARDTTQEED